MEKLILKHSSVKDKKPTAQQLDYGEIAINYNKDNPFISYKDTNNEIHTLKLTDVDLSGYAKKNEIPSLAGYATQKWVRDNYYDAGGVDTVVKEEIRKNNTYILTETNNRYYVKADCDAKYALKTDIPTVPTKVSAFENDKGYATETWVRNNYATKITKITWDGTDGDYENYKSDYYLDYSESARIFYNVIKNTNPKTYELVYSTYGTEYKPIISKIATEDNDNYRYYAYSDGSSIKIDINNNKIVYRCNDTNYQDRTINI